MCAPNCPTKLPFFAPSLSNTHTHMFFRTNEIRNSELLTKCWWNFYSSHLIWIWIWWAHFSFSYSEGADIYVKKIGGTTQNIRAADDYPSWFIYGHIVICVFCLFGFFLFLGPFAKHFFFSLGSKITSENILFFFFCFGGVFFFIISLYRFLPLFPNGQSVWLARLFVRSFFFLFAMAAAS